MKIVILLLLVAICLQTVTTKKKKNTSKAPKSCATSSVNGKQILRHGRIRYCEDGWTVFQKRFDGSVNFEQNWKTYNKGFGNMTGEFWLGLKKIHRLTRYNQCRLRIDLWDFDHHHKFAQYNYFSVESGKEKYRLHLAGYNGTAGDSLLYANHHNEMAFSTHDRDKDNYSGHCAKLNGEGQGGWWFNNCFYSALNAVWGRSYKYGQNIIWYTWKGFEVGLKATTMKLRCD